MAIIRLRNDEVWHRAGWVLRELLDLLAAEMPGDAEAEYTLKQADAFSALQLNLEEFALADRLEKVMLRVVHAVVDGRLPLRSRILQDSVSRDQFVSSMRELLKMMLVPVKGGASPE